MSCCITKPIVTLMISFDKVILLEEEDDNVSTVSADDIVAKTISFDKFADRTISISDIINSWWVWRSVYWINVSLQSCPNLLLLQMQLAVHNELDILQLATITPVFISLYSQVPLFEQSFWQCLDTIFNLSFSMHSLDVSNTSPI